MAQIKVKSEKQSKSKPTITINDKVYCGGSRRPITSQKGRKQVYQNYRYVNKYPCEVCGRFYMKNNLGLTLHGQIIDSAKKRTKATQSSCAECGVFLLEIDYLCESCRTLDIGG